jgi:hypothetical protein
MEELLEATPEEMQDMVKILEPTFRKLAKAISEGNEKKIHQLQSEVNEFREAADKKNYTEKISSILSKDKYEPYLEEIAKLADKIAPQEGVTEEEFFDYLLSMAKATGKVKLKDKIKEKKAEENFKEKLPSSANKSQKEVALGRNPTRQEAIKAAIAGKTIT